MTKDEKKISRRRFAGLIASASTGTSCIAELGPTKDEKPSPGASLDDKTYMLPPPDAHVQTTACAYCVVGCGYKAYNWPADKEEDENPKQIDVRDENALGVKFPVSPLSGNWVSPQMYNLVEIEGMKHHLVIVPDAEATVVNKGGDHNLGASLAQKLYSPEKTSDRLTTPSLRVGDKLYPISWDAATSLIAKISDYVLETSGKLAWGMKSYSYQFYENTYAITKFAFGAIGTPAWAPHDKPREGSDTPGLSDAGINAFSAAYADWKQADVLFVSGVSLYDAHSVLFSQWVMNGPRLIVVNPRKDVTATYAEENGGIYLQVKPGTDTVLQNAIARLILENGWEDSDFIEAHCTHADDIEEVQQSSWRRQRFGLTFSEYRQFILNTPLHELDNAADFTGVPAQLIEQAARMLSEKTNGERPKASFMFEKGNYWTHNYTNTASLASLGLLNGAGNRPGRVISRAGGHQRGMIHGAQYPIDLSPHRLLDNPATLNLDHWAMEGKLRFGWIVGCTWAGGGTAASAALYAKLRSQTQKGQSDRLDEQLLFPSDLQGELNVSAVLDSWKTRVDSEGLILVHQDLYPQAMGALCDLVLPAAGWGEAPFNRMQGERRLRHYPKLADAPGQAQPDWKVIAQVAQKMGFDGFDWQDENEIFEEAAEASKGANDYKNLVKAAKEEGTTATQLLSSLGTTGIQCPVHLEDGELLGTTRMHEDGFATPTGQALFVRGAWEDAEERHDLAKPAQGELWVINRRSSGTWSSMVEDARIPYRLSLWPSNWIEIHPDDADEFNISDGNKVRLRGRNVLTTEGPTSPAFEIKGVAQLTDNIRRGVCCLYFNYLGSPEFAANSLVQNTEDPINGLFAFKLGRGTLENAEES